MNSLNWKLILIATSALALTATTGFIIQTDAYVNLKKNFHRVFKENEKNKKQIELQARTIRQLGDELRIKEDSIAFLNLKVEALVRETNALKNKIRSLDQKVKQKSAKVAALTKKINALEKTNSADKKKIIALAEERDELLKQMEMMDRQRTEAKTKVEKKENKLRHSNHAINKMKKQQQVSTQQFDQALANFQKHLPVNAIQDILPISDFEEEKAEIIKARKQARLREIVMKTRVNFLSVKLSNEKDGNEIKKMKDGWRFLIAEFDLQNPDPVALRDEEFILQVFDLDNQRVVPVNEQNPAFPNSPTGTTGYRFTYEGKPLKIAYFNSQKKTGKNYEVRLYYAGKGFLLPLINGKTRIVKDGEVAAR